MKRSFYSHVLLVAAITSSSFAHAHFIRVNTRDLNLKFSGIADSKGVP